MPLQVEVIGTDWPAWVQAVGSVAAIVAAIVIDQGAARRLRRDRAVLQREAIQVLHDLIADAVAVVAPFEDHLLMSGWPKEHVTMEFERDLGRLRDCLDQLAPHDFGSAKAIRVRVAAREELDFALVSILGRVETIRRVGAVDSFVPIFIRQTSERLRKARDEVAIILKA